MVACQVCSHPKRHQIEIGLVYKTPLSALAVRFGCHRAALHRHRHRHLTPQMAAAILAAQQPSAIDLDALRTSESEGLLAQLVAQRARLQQHADLALELGNAAGAISAERAITSNLELVAKLLGTLITRHSMTSTHLLVSGDYLALRQTISTALREFPDAARAVGAALHKLESDAAREITAGSRPVMIEGKTLS